MAESLKRRNEIFTVETNKRLTLIALKSSELRYGSLRTRDTVVSFYK